MKFETVILRFRDLGLENGETIDRHKKIIENENNDELATSFMEFLEDVAPQYRENVLKASEYIEKKLETKK